MVQKLIFLEDEVVRRGHDQVGFGIDGFNFVGCIGHTGGGVSAERLAENLVAPYLRQLFLYQGNIIGTGDDIEIFLRDNFGKSLVEMWQVAWVQMRRLVFWV